MKDKKVKKLISLELPEVLLNDLKHQADLEDTTMSALIRAAIKAYIYDRK